MIETIDCEYVRSRLAASFLIKDQNDYAFIECNTSHSIPHLLRALQRSGGTPEQVKWIIITHVHLDHAGGAGALLAHCPNATLLAHPRAAKHLIDPAKLIASATQVYGREAFEKLYGTILPVPASRVRAMSDGESVQLGQRTFQFIHTRGHANHHFCIFDTSSRALFSGDAFGLAYPDLQNHGRFIFPSTSPTDFDPEAAIAVIDRIEALAPSAVYLTHFGPITDLANAARQLRRDLLFAGSSLTQARDSNLDNHALTESVLTQLRAHYTTRVAELFPPSEHARVLEYMTFDLEINAQGIAFQAQKLRANLGHT